ncbi:MAG: SGNH/GDSL hydrolase family protein [Cyclobacteriaceae bacterium]|nr:SGNH/GDSL hydrolase family protein [Cyclobacteriaceae bacterium]
MRRFSWLWLGMCCALCAQQPDAARTRILFVGNSLTYTNNLPQLVKEAGVKNNVRIQADMLAYPNYALEDHWNDGELQKLIAGGKYDYVIVQQGPSSQADGKAMLLEYGGRIKLLCDKHQAKLAFYMVWPARVNYHTFPGVIANYTLAASETNSVLCPVGEVWKAHFDATGDFSYYGPDGFHPSLAGSQRAAEIIFESLQIQ